MMSARYCCLQTLLPLQVGGVVLRCIPVYMKGWTMQMIEIHNHHKHYARCMMHLPHKVQTEMASLSFEALAQGQAASDESACAYYPAFVASSRASEKVCLR
jgi:hypothetical protein